VVGRPQKAGVSHLARPGFLLPTHQSTSEHGPLRSSIRPLQHLMKARWTRFLLPLKAVNRRAPFPRKPHAATTQFCVRFCGITAVSFSRNLPYRPLKPWLSFRQFNT